MFGAEIRMQFQERFCDQGYPNTGRSINPNCEIPSIQGYSNFGPFLSPDCEIPSDRSQGFFEDQEFKKSFKDEKIYSITHLFEKLKQTYTKLNDILKVCTAREIFWANRNLRPWAVTQMNNLIEIYPSESEKVNEQGGQSLLDEVISIYYLCIPLLIGVKGDQVDVLSDFVEKAKKLRGNNKISGQIMDSSPQGQLRQKKLVASIEAIAQEVIYQYRDEPMPANKWTYDTQRSARDIFESFIIDSPDIRIYFKQVQKNPLPETALWKILFHDQRTFTLFMRCTNSILHFKDHLTPFLNTMGKMREDSEAFEALACNHNEVLKSIIKLPQWDNLGLDPQTKSKIQLGWDNFDSKFEKDRLFPPVWVELEPINKTLFGNLYNPVNRLLYPNADPEKLANVPKEKVEWAADVLKELNENTCERYKELLRDSQCTRYALKAYLTGEIKASQFVSLCMAWSAVNVYDPELKTTKIVRCNDPSIRPYYHEKYSELNNSMNIEKTGKKNLPLDAIIDSAIILTKNAKEESEQFVLLLDFDTNFSLMGDKIDSQLMRTIQEFDYFLFPNKMHWIIPSVTLMNSMLQTIFGEEYAKPVIGLGDFSVEDLAAALIKGDRPFQINMWNVGNSIRADKHLTAGLQLLSDPSRTLNDPSMWLHDLFHLYVLGAIPLEHRKRFYKLAQCILQKASMVETGKASVYKEAYERIIDMQFLAYERATEADKSNGYSEAFQKSINAVLNSYPAVRDIAEKFLASNKN